ncbi:MFS antiporter Qdrp1 [[Candida] railenensis]|uniref:MFS antiporter Qdrp1 n=1 Tax=[Candida] railenensis TaxID=45579 RepID=A0A9P0QJT9_9ASCO|nr:MFS antiporter Qdrp1 [[Candida] railenensis]
MSQVARKSEASADHDKVEMAEVNNDEVVQDVLTPPYSIVKRSEQIFLIILLSLCGFWSTIANTIYFPALPILSDYFSVSESVMTLSLVAYLIFQGLVPTVSSNLADTFGRRPMMLICLIIFIASCIALSRVNVFWALTVLRCVQASGIAPTISINSGIAGDVTTRADRGGFVGIVSGAQLLGNGFGGLIGSGIMSSFDWRAIFIFLAIGSAVTFIIAALLLPETNRSFVGNGSIKPKRFYHKSLFLYMPFLQDRFDNDLSTLKPKQTLDILSPLRILSNPKVLVTLLACGLPFASWTMALTSISTILEAKYNYSVIHVGYIYVPQGVALLVSSFSTGQFLNWYYKRSLQKYEDKHAGVPEEDRPPFNIYRARLDLMFPASMLMASGLIIFGWCLQFRQNISSIIISSMMISMPTSCFISSGTTMLVDLYPSRGSTSTSCMNLMRCLLAALFSGVLSKMTDAMGVGGCYTLMAGLCLGSYGLLLLVVLTEKKVSKAE